jgi:hypothetical protein
MTDPDLRAALASLITQWRKEADSIELKWGNRGQLVRLLRRCAKQGEALLTPVAPTPEPPQ